MENTMQRISWRPIEVAAVTGLSLRHVHAAIARKELRSLRIGRARIIRDADLHAWIDGGIKAQAAAAR